MSDHDQADVLREADAALAELQRTFVNTGRTNERRAALYWAAERVGEMRKALATRHAPHVTITMPESVARSVLQAVTDDPDRSKWGHHQHDRTIAQQAITAALAPSQPGHEAG